MSKAFKIYSGDYSKDGYDSYESHLQMVTQLKETLTALQNKIESLKENYKKQIDAMENASFMDNYITPYYLNDLNVELKYVAQQYQESVNQLKSFGYFKEKMPHLENLCSEFETTIDGVVEYVESEHIGYVYGRGQTVSGVLSQSLGVIGVGKQPPLPPNRACGSPAHGS